MECDLLMIKIEKVINKNDLKAFIAFPSSLYPDDPNWIPPLFIERNEHLSAKNPGTDHIIWQAWVAKKAGQIVGRITAQIDTLHRERYGKDTGHFGMIDAIDDPQVFAALFGAAEAWLKSQGASKISGPFSLNINQESGLLIEGFDTPPCAMMPHGKPWYAAHIEQLGYHKGIDLLAWWMQRTDLMRSKQFFIVAPPVLWYTVYSAYFVHLTCFCYTTFFQKVKSRTIGITIIYGKPMFFVKILVSARLPGASVL